MTRLRGVFCAVVITLSGCGATIGDACTTNRDCGTTGTCLNRDFTPGGTCTLACTLGGPACPAGSTCVDDAIARDDGTRFAFTPMLAILSAQSAARLQQFRISFTQPVLTGTRVDVLSTDSDYEVLDSEGKVLAFGNFARAWRD
jgi:hypothetical protein